MAKIFNGKVLFASAMQPTGAQPLDDRVVVQSYSDLVDVTTFGDAKYLGMVVGVVDDSKLYMLTNTDVAAEGAWKEIGAGGAVSVETYAEAVELASDENIGQVIYVKNTTYKKGEGYTSNAEEADKDEAGNPIEYGAAPYIVIGNGSLQKLAASTASGNIEGDVAELTTKVSALETTIGNAEAGLAKDVEDLKSAVDALPETFVTDVKDASGNSLVEDGVVTLGDYATKTEVNNGLAEKVDVSVYNDKMTQVDASIAEKADASTVEIALDGKVDKVTDHSLVSDALITKLGNMVEIKSVGGDLKLSDAGELTVTIPEVEVPEYTVVKLATAEEGYATSYQLQKDSVGIGAVINIPKDMVVSSGEVRELTEGEITDARPQGLYIVLTLANATNDKLYIPAKDLVDDYTGSDYIEVSADRKISVKYDELKTDFDSVYDAFGSADTVNTALEVYKASNDAAVAAKVNSSDYTKKMTEIDNSIGNVYTKTEVNDLVSPLATKEYVDASLNLKANANDVYSKADADASIAAAIAPLASTEALGAGLATKVNSSDYNEKMADIDASLSTFAVKTDVDASLNLKANANDVYTKTEVNDLVSPLAVKTDVDASLAGKVDKVADHSLVSDTLIAKLDNLATINTVATSDELKLENGTLSVDLSAYAKISDVNTSLATKLNANATVNGVPFENHAVTLDTANIKLDASFGKKEVEGKQVDRYTTDNDIQYVLNDIDTRIDAINTTIDNVTGGGVIADITAGDGINVDKTTKTNPTVSVKVDESTVKIDSNAKVALKVSAEEKQALEVKTDGVYVSDMRSYWEAI